MQYLQVERKGVKLTTSGLNFINPVKPQGGKGQDLKTELRITLLMPQSKTIPLKKSSLKIRREDQPLIITIKDLINIG